jgi:diguanylate cyclase (GGDEF)-like protein
MSPGFKLLIVDDEKQNRALLTELLKDDYQIILAKNGDQALARAREHAPDLILLDVLMPGMDGYAVIRALKEDDRTRDIPVIFITALDADTDEERGLDLGAVDYVAKPFRPSILRARVRNHLQSVHQRRLLEKLAMLDSLTEIPNRRRFTQVYEQEWRRGLRNRQPLSLVMIDVDLFKAYNDAHGHAAGDLALYRVAQALEAAVRRPGDFVARYGGEEFVLLLPEADAAGARMLAEQARRGVEALHIPHVASPHGWLTISLGGTTLVPDEIHAESDLFLRADASLYEAKRQGRNRVEWAASAS